jgi:hypothetical protein
MIIHTRYLNNKFAAMRLLLILSIITFLASACQKDSNNDVNDNCPEKAIVSESQYNREIQNPYTIENAYVEDQCLFIEISHSGGCAELTYILADAGNVAESYPVQRWIKLQVDGLDPCDGIVQKVLSFDLTPIQADGENISTLHLFDWSESLTHEYP